VAAYSVLSSLGVLSVCAAMTATFAVVADANAVQMVELRVKVTDSEGSPVEGVRLEGSFFQDRTIDKIARASHSGLTDTDGTVLLGGREELYVDLWATKEGYYETTKRVIVRNNPSQDVSLLLRKIRNPIAMYAKRIVLNAGGDRRTDEQFGYDLMAGDFVAPHGKGTVSDILITHSFEEQDFWH
jgi:hypothetical protein